MSIQKQQQEGKKERRRKANVKVFVLHTNSINVTGNKCKK